MIGGSKQHIGSWGEDHAVVFLQKHGYEVIDRNFHTRFGELDIIAWSDKPFHGRTLCFIEVKTRSGMHGTAERATNRRKLKNIFSAAQIFCLRSGIFMESTPIQFEQVSVYFHQDDGGPLCKHYVIPVE
jgi:putative endonuclease